MSYDTNLHRISVFKYVSADPTWFVGVSSENNVLSITSASPDIIFNSAVVTVAPSSISSSASFKAASPTVTEPPLIAPVVVIDEDPTSMFPKPDVMDPEFKNFEASLNEDGTSLEFGLKGGAKFDMNKFNANLIHPDNFDFFETLRKKLNWGYDLRN